MRRRALAGLFVLAACGVERTAPPAPTLTLEQMVACTAFHDAEMMRLASRGGEDAAFEAARALSADWGLAAAATALEAGETTESLKERIAARTEALFVEAGVNPDGYAAVRAACDVFEGGAGRDPAS